MVLDNFTCLFRDQVPPLGTVTPCLWRRLPWWCKSSLSTLGRLCLQPLQLHGRKKSLLFFHRANGANYGLPYRFLRYGCLAQRLQPILFLLSDLLMAVDSMNTWLMKVARYRTHDLDESANLDVSRPLPIFLANRLLVRPMTRFKFLGLHGTIRGLPLAKFLLGVRKNLIQLVAGLKP